MLTRVYGNDGSRVCCLTVQWCSVQRVPHFNFELCTLYFALCCPLGGPKRAIVLWALSRQEHFSDGMGDREVPAARSGQVGSLAIPSKRREQGSRVGEGGEALGVIT